MSSMFGARFRHRLSGRCMTILDEYAAEFPEDSHGYTYIYDDERTIYWLSTSALSVRFTKEHADEHDC